MLLIDESDDVAGKEQMTAVIRYVNSEGFIKERFLGIVMTYEIEVIGALEMILMLGFGASIGTQHFSLCIALFFI